RHDPAPPALDLETQTVPLEGTDLDGERAEVATEAERPTETAETAPTVHEAAAPEDDMLDLDPAGDEKVGVKPSDS
ncbi:MAG: hypothetical protein ACRCSL_10765, partial [Microbacterium sp.]